MKILVALDGSAQALAAVRHALRMHREGLNAAFVFADAIIWAREA